MKRIRVGVLFGGRSAEHEISIITTLQAIQAMDPLQYEVIPIYIAPSGKWYTGNPLLEKKFYHPFSENHPKIQEVTLLPQPRVGGILPLASSLKQLIPVDVYFLGFHGEYGEDGCIQGLLELADVPFTGCGVMSSAVAMNKYVCKMFLKAHGIPVLPSTVVKRKTAMQDLSQARNQIYSTPGLNQFPLFVKPCHLGSSIGISIARDDRSLNAALAKVFQYDDEAIIEPCVVNLMEINVAVLDGNPPLASVVEIPIASGQALTYEDKYQRQESKHGGTSQSGMAGLTRIIDPKELDSTLKTQVIDTALKAFSLLDCSGLGRFDFIFDKASGQLYFNELNPIPGSLAFYLWEKSHPPLLYTEVIHQMLQRAIEIHQEKRSLSHSLN